MTEATATEGGESGRSEITPDQFLERLKRALMRNGDFPASAKVVSELRQLTSDPHTTANQITEVILRDPSLGVRVLHLVNSSYYRRAKPITTVSQAIVQVGMKPLADLCAGLILLQRFVPEARRNSAFAACLRKTLVTSVVACTFSQRAAEKNRSISQRNAEAGYLAGTLAEMGVLLMAFYFPQVYETAVKRSEQKRQDLSLSIQQITGLSSAQLSTQVIETLNLPKFYSDIVICGDLLRRGEPLPPGTSADISGPAKFVGAATEISHSLVTESSPDAIAKTINDIQRSMQIDNDLLLTVLGGITDQLSDHCSTLELSVPPLSFDPATVAQRLNGEAPAAAEKPADDTSGRRLNLGAAQEQFDLYLQEIRVAIENQEPTASIVTSVMEACAFCLNFDRVVLLLAGANKKALIGRMILGSVPGFDPTKCVRPIGDGAGEYAPDSVAFVRGRPVFQGDPLFGGWPLAAIPVGSGRRAIGVIYAERGTPDSPELTATEQAAIVMLADMLDRSLQKTASGIGI